MKRLRPGYKQRGGDRPPVKFGIFWYFIDGLDVEGRDAKRGIRDSLECGLNNWVSNGAVDWDGEGLGVRRLFTGETKG